jgi:hypothetical protein
LNANAPSPGDLIGHELTTSFLAADMRMFGFGVARPFKDGVIADYSLHLQCPWRFEANSATLVSSRDLYRYGGDDAEPAGWDYSAGNSRQDRRLGSILGPRLPVGEAWAYRSGLVVVAVEGSPRGDLEITFGSGAALRVFALGGDEEQWRLFRPAANEEHLVFGGEVDD